MYVVFLTYLNKDSITQYSDIFYRKEDIEKWFKQFGLDVKSTNLIYKDKNKEIIIKQK